MTPPPNRKESAPHRLVSLSSWQSCWWEARQQDRNQAGASSNLQLGVESWGVCNGSWLQCQQTAASRAACRSSRTAHAASSSSSTRRWRQSVPKVRVPLVVLLLCRQGTACQAPYRAIPATEPAPGIGSSGSWASGGGRQLGGFGRLTSKLTSRTLDGNYSVFRWPVCPERRHFEAQTLQIDEAFTQRDCRQLPEKWLFRI